jgi:hypothetical protein
LHSLEFTQNFITLSPHNPYHLVEERLSNFAVNPDLSPNFGTQSQDCNRRLQGDARPEKGCAL